MKSFMGGFIALMLSVSVGAEPLLEGRVRLSSGQPAAGVQVRLFDLTDLRRSVGTTTDVAGHFALSLQAFSTARGAALPADFALGQNYPNPFNPSTIIPYQLPASGHVRLEVFNMLGQRLATLVDAERSAGAHTAQWDGTDAAGRAVGAGVYIYRLSSGGITESRRMVLVDGQAGIPAAGAALGPRRSSVENSVEADGPVYGLTVSGQGLVAYVDPAFQVGIDAASIVVESYEGAPRMKLASGGVLGDVNNDGLVDLVDLLFMMLYSMDPSIILPNNGDIYLGDINGDGTVDPTDAVLIIRYFTDPSDPSLPPEIGDDKNNTLSEATQIDLGSSTTGTLSQGDEDYFVVEMSSAGILSAFTTIDSTSAEETDGIFISILDSSGYVSDESHDLVSTIVSSGTYYILVKDDWGDDYYTLHVTFSEVPKVSLGSSTAGTLSEGDDEDYFAVEMNSAGLLSATTTGSTDTHGAILDSSGNVLAINDDDGKDSNFRVLAFVPSGTYYIRVIGDWGDYTLHVSDGRSEVPKVSLGSSTAGSISLSGDEDYFAVEMSSAGLLSATTTGSTDTHGSILDSSGNILAVNDDDEDSNFWVYAPVSSGTYYIVIGGAYWDTGDYTLHVNDLLSGATETVALVGTVITSVENAFFFALSSEAEEFLGAGGGTLTIAGNTWTLQDYSPDGALIINGTLDVAKDQFPTVPVVGTIEISGSFENTVSLDIVVDASGTRISTTGTVTIDGEVFDIAEIIAEIIEAATHG